MAKANLSVVPAPESTPTGPANVMSVEEACRSGTKLDKLRATQFVVARAIDDPDTSARDLAALTRRLGEINKELDSLEAAEEQAGKRAAKTRDESFALAAI